MAHLICTYLLYILTILFASLCSDVWNDKFQSKGMKSEALALMVLTVTIESAFIFTTKNALRQEIVTDYENGKFSYEKVEEVKYIDGIAVDTITTFNIKK